MNNIFGNLTPRDYYNWRIQQEEMVLIYKHPNFGPKNVPDIRQRKKIEIAQDRRAFWQPNAPIIPPTRYRKKYHQDLYEMYEEIVRQRWRRNYNLIQIKAILIVIEERWRDKKNLYLQQAMRRDNFRFYDDFSSSDEEQ